MQAYAENNSQGKIIYFPDQLIAGIELPKRFTFPFFYEPHPLTRIAAAQLQQYLEIEAVLDHNFGLNGEQEAAVPIGKMFGVLVVQDVAGKVGYLSAFSGKLGGSNDHLRFVPPVFDMLTENSFFLQEQENINSLNAQVKAIWSDAEYVHLRQQLDQFSAQYTLEAAALKKQLKKNKQHRKQLREEHQRQLNIYDHGLMEAYLIKYSLHDKYLLKTLTEKWEQLLEQTRQGIAVFEDRTEALKNERRERSADLQQQLFEQYAFLNQAGQSKSLQAIFGATAFGQPPAGAGECATPKLLQFAFANGYKPLAMAEFWWGASPKSEIRKHKQFYPACTGKCKPILSHMLQGISVDDNPLLLNPGEGTQLEIIFEDDWLVVVNKPAGLRSVPGVDIDDSVYSRLQQLWAGMEPLIIHRLDMGTSGLLVVAKTPDTHKHIQKQFLNRTVSKRYVALLSKAIDQTGGEIRLPLTGDPFNRPRQLVCFETGKKSITRWQAVHTTATTTKVHFWPLTGRTHQLRMHSAHEQGLNAPIVGDDLYGTPASRLYLHAAYLEFTHPQTGKKLSFEVPEDF